MSGLKLVRVALLLGSAETREVHDFPDPHVKSDGMKYPSDQQQDTELKSKVLGIVAEHGLPVFVLHSAHITQN